MTHVTILVGASVAGTPKFEKLGKFSPHRDRDTRLEELFQNAIRDRSLRPNGCRTQHLYVHADSSWTTFPRTICSEILRAATGPTCTEVLARTRFEAAPGSRGPQGRPRWRRFALGGLGVVVNRGSGRVDLDEGHCSDRLCLVGVALRVAEDAAVAGHDPEVVGLVPIGSGPDFEADQRVLLSGIPVTHTSGSCLHVANTCVSWGCLSCSDGIRPGGDRGQATSPDPPRSPRCVLRLGWRRREVAHVGHR